jgi:hypothetical protein
MAFELNHEKACFPQKGPKLLPPGAEIKTDPDDGRRCRAVVTDQEWWQLSDNQIHIVKLLHLLLTSTRASTVCMSRLSNIFMDIDVVQRRRRHGGAAICHHFTTTSIIIVAEEIGTTLFAIIISKFIIFLRTT